MDLLPIAELLLGMLKELFGALKALFELLRAREEVRSPPTRGLPKHLKRRDAKTGILASQ
jgi:hypothetical protein